jgi:uncharacterized protein YxeA
MVNRRGQLILTAAILLALTIVASAVLLNSIHAPADVTAQQERQSLEQTERIIEQLQDDLNEVFMVNGSTERMPYIEGGPQAQNEFEATVEAYAEQYLNMSTRNGVGFTTVEYLESESKEDGYAVWQNETEQLSGSKWVLVNGNPDRVTYLKLYIEDVRSSGFELQKNGGGGTAVLSITDDVDVSVNGVTKCSGKTVNEANPLVFELIDGEGEIRIGDELCGAVDFGSSFTPQNLQIPGSSDADGEIYVTYKGGNSPGGLLSQPYRGTSNKVVVQPVYHITYQDPQVTYETNVTAYGGGS